jgi:hypothetical protein
MSWLTAMALGEKPQCNTIPRTDDECKLLLPALVPKTTGSILYYQPNNNLPDAVQMDPSSPLKRHLHLTSIGHIDPVRINILDKHGKGV